MERRLLADHGMKRDTEQWLAAWNLQKPKKDARPAPAGGKKPEEKPAE
jgi:hypothetical protein